MAVHHKLSVLAVSLSAALFLAGCNNDVAATDSATPAQAEPATPVGDSMTDQVIQPTAVITHYADLAHAVFADALATAKALDTATDALIAEPSEANLAAARQAWIEARVPYQQSEVFRFGNPVVDDWEGQLNAWPLDEGLIDYVAAEGYQHELGNEGATANIIGSSSLTIGGEQLDVSQLNADLLASLNEVGGSEANVATGYHAIEFLLWGQDLQGYQRGAGERPYTDYVVGDACTQGNCERRGDYLNAATDLLVSDLQWMVEQWSAEGDDNYRAQLLALPVEDAVQRMLFGMGSLSLGELAGERMKVALEANSYEDEHDCFSDNTHNSHYYNGKGIQNVYLGQFLRSDGSELNGPSLADLVAIQDAELDARLRNELDASMTALGAIKGAAEQEDQPVFFDMMIAPDNAEGAALIDQAIAALVGQTASIEQVAALLGVEALRPDDAGHAF